MSADDARDCWEELRARLSPAAGTVTRTKLPNAANVYSFTESEVRRTSRIVVDLFDGDFGKALAYARRMEDRRTESLFARAVRVDVQRRMTALKNPPTHKILVHADPDL